MSWKNWKILGFSGKKSQKIFSQEENPGTLPGSWIWVRMDQHSEFWPNSLTPTQRPWYILWCIFTREQDYNCFIFNMVEVHTTAETLKMGVWSTSKMIPKKSLVCVCVFHFVLRNLADLCGVGRARKPYDARGTGLWESETVVGGWQSTTPRLRLCQYSLATWRCVCV